MVNIPDIKELDLNKVSVLFKIPSDYTGDASYYYNNVEITEQPLFVLGDIPVYTVDKSDKTGLVCLKGLYVPEQKQEVFLKNYNWNGYYKKVYFGVLDKLLLA